MEFEDEEFKFPQKSQQEKYEVFVAPPQEEENDYLNSALIPEEESAENPKFNLSYHSSALHSPSQNYVESVMIPTDEEPRQSQLRLSVEPPELEDSEAEFKEFDELTALKEKISVERNMMDQLKDQNSKLEKMYMYLNKCNMTGAGYNQDEYLEKKKEILQVNQINNVRQKINF